MKKLTIALLVLFAIACSKNEDSSNLQLNGQLAGGGDTDPDSTGFTGVGGCYWTLTNTLENPPSGYIPGSAETTFGTCAEKYMNLGGTAPGPKKYPPAPRVTFTKAPPSTGVTNDNRTLQYFFNIGGVLIGKPPMDEASAGALINYYNTLILTALETYPTDDNAANKINSCITYIFNYPPADPSFDTSQFLDYVNNVAYRYSSPLRITLSYASQLGIFTPESDRIFKVIIPNIPFPPRFPR